LIEVVERETKKELLGEIATGKAEWLK
jgi:hypothetical protein